MGDGRPRARLRVPALRVIVRVLVFGGAVLALADVGHPAWAGALGVTVVGVHVLARLSGADPLQPSVVG